MTRIQELEIPMKDMWWYLDTRKFGSMIDIHPRMEGTTEYCMEFVPGEVDFREIIHPKRDWR